MNDKPNVNIGYSEPGISHQPVGNVDELDSSLRWLGITGKYVTFAGSIVDSGAAYFLPKGWSSTRTATGDYTITHGLGTAQYIVLLTPINQTAGTGNSLGYVTAKNANTVRITWATAGGGVAVNHNFDFILIKVL
jgi:hypothetical protein